MTRIDQRFDQVERNFDRVWVSFDRMSDEFREIRGQMAARDRQMAQIGWALVGILVVQLIAMLVAFA